MKRKSIVLFLCFFILGIIPCRAEERAKHVILIGLDGWGAHNMEKADMPHVKQLMDKGCYTLQKRSVLPSSSAVNWASMFMGAGPELHGYTEWNSRVPDLPSRDSTSNGIFPTIFNLLRDKCPEAKIGCLYEWEGIKYVVDTLALSHYELAPDYKKYPRALCEMAENYIKEKKPKLLAVCFDNPDHVGHKAGHGSPAYYEKLAELDGYIGRIIRAVKDAGMSDNTIFIVTSDHGGIGKGHGGKSMQEMETPFIISGKNVKKNGAFHESMMQYDVASTIAYIFSLQQPQVWIGRPMKQVFW